MVCSLRFSRLEVDHMGYLSVSFEGQDQADRNLAVNPRKKFTHQTRKGMCQIVRVSGPDRPSEVCVQNWRPAGVRSRGMEHECMSPQSQADEPCYT